MPVCICNARDCLPAMDVHLNYSALLAAPSLFLVGFYSSWVVPQRVFEECPSMTLSILMFLACSTLDHSPVNLCRYAKGRLRSSYWMWGTLPGLHIQKVLPTVLSSSEYEKLHNLNSSPDIFRIMHLFQINIRNNNIWHSSMNGKGCWKSDCLNEMERVVNVLQASIQT